MNTTYPTIVPTYAFKLSSYIIKRVKLPFTDTELFNEFSSLLETLVLSNEIQYYNIGPQKMEWEGGDIYRDFPKIHPYEAFNKLTFINESKHINSLQRISLKQDIGGKIAKAHFKGRTYHSYTVGIYNMCMLRAYNGDFGNVSINVPPLVKELLPKLLVYNDSDKPIANDSLIFQAYQKLKDTYSSKLSEIDFNNSVKFKIPPLTSILLSRLPNNCTDPYKITNEILELRGQLTSVRNRFNEYQNVFYSDSYSIKEAQKVFKAINIDSEMFSKKFNATYMDNTFLKLSLDNLSFIIKLLRKGEVDYEEIATVLSKFAPSLIDRFGIMTPSRMYSFAMKSKNIKEIGRLSELKLGLKI